MKHLINKESNMTKSETIQVLQSIEDRAVDFPNMTACDWVAIAAAKRHLTNSIEYTRKDKFIDVACEWISKHCVDECYLIRDNDGTWVDFATLLYDFRNSMKGE